MNMQYIPKQKHSGVNKVELIVRREKQKHVQDVYKAAGAMVSFISQIELQG